MWSADFHPGKQLLEIRFSRSVPVEEARVCAQKIRELLAGAAPGFVLLTDLSGLEQMDLACEPFIDQMMDEFNAKGIRKVVRVIPDPETDIGFGIMSLFHYRPQVRVITCKDAEEAKEHLPP